MDVLPYRPNVGALIFNRHGDVLIAKRCDSSMRKRAIWQCPQGGIDPGEQPRTALLREVKEETGLCEDIEIIGEFPQWLSYDLPPHLIGKALGGRFRGQTQKWFALLFSGEDQKIVLNAEGPKEFSQWTWFPLDRLASVNTLKGRIYSKIADYFAPLSKKLKLRDQQP